MTHLVLSLEFGKAWSYVANVSSLMILPLYQDSRNRRGQIEFSCSSNETNNSCHYLADTSSSFLYHLSDYYIFIIIIPLCVPYPFPCVVGFIQVINGILFI